jgi:DNA-binding MarR family transcriptional regulator
MGSNTSARQRDTRTVLDAIRRIVQALRESSRFAEKQVGLSGAQLFVLQKLDEAPALSVNELAACTHTHQSSVSTVIARLVERGLVERAMSASDRRTVRLSLTPRGRNLVRRAPDVAQGRLIRAIAHLPVARRRALALGLDDLAQTVADVARAPAMFFEETSARKSRRSRLKKEQSAHV